MYSVIKNMYTQGPLSSPLFKNTHMIPGQTVVFVTVVKPDVHSSFGLGYGKNRDIKPEPVVVTLLVPTATHPHVFLQHRGRVGRLPALSIKCYLFLFGKCLFLFGKGFEFGG